MFRPSFTSRALRPLIGAGLLLASAAAQAQAQTLFSDPSVEISGNGARSWRNCTITFKPAMTYGEPPARLVLTTSSQTKIAVTVDRPTQYSAVTVVQNGNRKPFPGVDTLAVEQFRNSDIGKALASKRTFFVTAQRTDGKFVSSRYEKIDFDAILNRIEANCPFDAESLMTDTAARERAERALSVSSDDLTLIRWALNKKYGGSSDEPSTAYSLSSSERGYLKRYTGENGLPMSQYLTSESARKLTVEGKAVQEAAKPPAMWNAVAGGIWKVKGRVRVATGYSGLKSTPEAAREAAEDACREIGRNCKATGAWNAGCIYIAVGSNRGGAGWSAAATSEDAYAKCRRNGYSCKTPIGGCVD